MESCILGTDGKTDKKFREMFASDQLTIALPHRASLTLVRIGDELFLESDLGMVSSECDLKRICRIDLGEKTYPEAVWMDQDFMRAAKSYDCHSQTKKFVNSYNYPDHPFDVGISAGLFGSEWLDQVRVNLEMDNLLRSITDIEFSIFRETRDDILGEGGKLDEPAMTLVSSLKLKGQKPHYFLFITWWGGKSWTYGRNFFFNNTKFPMKKKEAAIDSRRL